MSQNLRRLCIINKTPPPPPPAGSQYLKAESCHIQRTVCPNKWWLSGPVTMTVKQIAPKLNDRNQPPYYLTPKFVGQEFGKGITYAGLYWSKQSQASPDSREKELDSARWWAWQVLLCTGTYNGSCYWSHLWKGQSATRNLCSLTKSHQINQATSMHSLERTMLNIHQSHFLNKLSHASGFTLSTSGRATAAAPHTSKATLRKCPPWQCFPSSSWSHGLIQKYVFAQLFQHSGGLTQGRGLSLMGDPESKWRRFNKTSWTESVNW